eukprot:jgi/Astpho2/135/Aster-04600
MEGSGFKSQQSPAPETRPLLFAGGSLADLFFGPAGGTGFVMAREKNGPGLVLQKHCSAVQLVDRDERQRVLALQQVLHGPAPLAHFVQDLETIDVTDFATVLEDAVNVTPSAARCLPGAAFPPTQCMGIVWKGRDPLDEVYDEEGELIETTHARRTKAVRFTCKLCGTTMTKAVNPHAWEQGSVFARCDGPRCKVIHNLVDNLRIIKYLKL